MELNKNDAAVCPDSIDAQDCTTRAEIDLYDELIAFAELPPEERFRLGDQTDKQPSELDERSADNAQEHSLPEPVVTPAPVEAETAVVETAQRTTEEPEPPAAEESESHSSSVHLIATRPIDLLESETASEQSTSPSAEAPAEPEPTGAAIEAVEAVSAVETETTEEENTSFELAEGYSPVEPVESFAIVPVAESSSDSEVSLESVDTSDLRKPPVAGPRPSGPLSVFDLPPEIVYTGALSPGVCLACGAESGADDLFCLSCGVFIDEIASTLPSKPTCGECKRRIEADEIFCPWCGSAVQS